MKILITGATGFVGSHLADYLIDDKHLEVHGIRRPRSLSEFTRPDVIYHEADITDLPSLYNLLGILNPDIIFHLAAQSFVPLSWQAPVSTFETNAIGTMNVLEAVRTACPSTVIHVAGSSEEYGMLLPSDCPIKESQPLNPLSPYGVSKVTADLLAQQYHRSYGLRTVITRAFNHTGPRRGEQFVTSKIAKKCALIFLGKAEPVLSLGNLDAVRDFTDVRDMVRAYWLATEMNPFGIPLNIGSGIGHTILEVADTLTAIMGLAVTIEQDPQFMRPSDVPYLIADSTDFRILTKWKPEIPFEQTMRDLFDYWMERLK